MGKTEKTARPGDTRLTAEARKAFETALKSKDIAFAVRQIARFLTESPYEEYKVARYSQATGKPRGYTWVRDDRGWDGLEGPFYQVTDDNYDEDENTDEQPLLQELKARLKEGQLMVISVGSDNYVFEHRAADGRVPAYLRLHKSV